jgi:hydrogenase maturation protease
MSSSRVLIACVGNIFLGDDGFGVEVARRLSGRSLPEGVVLKDFGIRGFDLTYALLDGYDLTILVDACPRGAAPGTLHLIEPDPAAEDSSVAQPAPLEMHGMNPMNVLRMVRSLGGEPKRILVVGCEPAELESDEDGRLGLSEPVEAAVDEAVALVERLVAEAVLQTQ